MKSRFAVLHAIIAGTIGAFQAGSEIGKATILKNLFHDVGNAHVLEDAAIGKQREKPEPGDHLRLVGSHAVRSVLQELHAADVAVDMAFGVLIERQREHGRLGKQALHVHIGIGRKQSQHEAERLGYALDAGEAVEQQGVVAERRLYAKWPVNLCRWQAVPIAATTGRSGRAASPPVSYEYTKEPPSPMPT